MAGCIGNTNTDLLVCHLDVYHLLEVYHYSVKDPRFPSLLIPIALCLPKASHPPFEREYLFKRMSYNLQCSTRSQCCIWYDWPSALTSYTGIIIWYQRQGFGLVPVISNRSHSNSSDQEINIWTARVEIWCATGVRSGPHSIHHLHHTTGPTHQEAWSDFPSICRRYPALFSIQTLRAFIHC